MLEERDFKSANVKKMQPSCYYRAKLDDTNRLLFVPAYNEEQYYLLILEVIKNHDYNGSRFLRGESKIDEHKISVIEKNKSEMTVDLVVKPIDNKVHCLDKFIVFDDAQASILNYPLPLIVIGSAGSGKTSVTLEKLKSLQGNVLYISLSNYLVEHTQKIYFANHYENQQQEIDFLSFQEYLESILIPQGKEITQNSFNQWLSNQNVSKSIRDGQKLFEEIKGY